MACIAIDFDDGYPLRTREPVPNVETATATTAVSVSFGNLYGRECIMRGCFSEINRACTPGESLEPNFPEQFQRILPEIVIKNAHAMCARPPERESRGNDKSFSPDYFAVAHIRRSFVGETFKPAIDFDVT